VEDLAVMPVSFNQKDAVCIVSRCHFPKLACLFMGQGMSPSHGFLFPSNPLTRQLWCIPDNNETFQKRHLAAESLR
jgi:hypothetical protein